MDQEAKQSKTKNISDNQQPSGGQADVKLLRHRSCSSCDFGIYYGYWFAASILFRLSMWILPILL